MFQLSMRVSTTKVDTPPLPQGKSTLANTCMVPAPSSRAAWRMSAGTERKICVSKKVPRREGQGQQQAQ